MGRLDLRFPCSVPLLAVVPVVVVAVTAVVLTTDLAAGCAGRGVHVRVRLALTHCPDQVGEARCTDLDTLAGRSDDVVSLDRAVEDGLRRLAWRTSRLRGVAAEPGADAA